MVIDPVRGRTGSTLTPSIQQGHEVLSGESKAGTLASPQSKAYKGESKRGSYFRNRILVRSVPLLAREDCTACRGLTTSIRLIFQQHQRQHHPHQHLLHPQPMGACIKITAGNTHETAAVNSEDKAQALRARREKRTVCNDKD